MRPITAPSLGPGPRCGTAPQPGASDGQALAALGAAGVDDGAAPAGLHTNEKTMGAGAANFGGLVGAFHGCRWLARLAGVPLGLGKPTITPKSPFKVKDLARMPVICGDLTGGRGLWITADCAPPTP